MANYLKDNPDAKASVTGYADSGTGTAEINQRLARQRAEAVRDLLVQKYGIDESRLTVDSKGSSEQPFAENDWNRVVIMCRDRTSGASPCFFHGLAWAAGGRFEIYSYLCRKQKLGETI